MRSTRQGMGRASSAAPCTRPGWAPPPRGGVARLTLYDLLGVSSDANAADVRAAYRRAARQLHPDIDSSVAARDRFALVRLAADVLASPQLRAAYDVHGAGALAGGRFEPLRELLAAGALPSIAVCSLLSHPTLLLLPH
jgi:DnaJ domain